MNLFPESVFLNVSDLLIRDASLILRYITKDYAKQQAYDKNWSLCNTLVERNCSIKKECEGKQIDVVSFIEKKDISIGRICMEP